MISLLKLVDGTEIIGNIQKNGDTVTVTDPLQVNYYVRTPASPPVISMYRYMPLSRETSFVFFRDHILSIVSPKAGMISYYNATLKDITEFMDNNLDNELLERAGELGAHTSEENELLQAVLERAIKKPTLN